MRGHQVAFIVFVAVVLAACGSGSDDVADPSTDTSPGTTVGSGSSAVTAAGATSTVAPPTTEGSTVEGDDEIDSVRWGPDDPPIPGEYLAFAADSADGLACDSIDQRASDDEFWALAGDICRVFTGEGEWPDAATVPPTPQDGNTYQRCLDAELSHVLEGALAWHAAHPGETPVVRYPSSGTHSACQTSLYDVGVTDWELESDDCDDDQFSDVLASAIPVTVSAPGMTDIENLQVTGDGIALCVVFDSTDDALRTLVVVVPTSGDAHTVTIAVESNYGTLSATVELPAIDVESTTIAPPEPSDTATTDASDDE